MRLTFCIFLLIANFSTAYSQTEGNKPLTLKHQDNKPQNGVRKVEVGLSASTHAQGVNAAPVAASAATTDKNTATAGDDIFGSASANNMIKKGAVLFDVGIGMYRSRYFLTGLGWPAILTTSSLEYGFTDKISAGAFAGFYYRRTNLYRIAGSSFRGYHVGVPLGVCASLHLSDMLNDVLDAGVEVDQLDFYGRLYAGLSFERLRYRNLPIFTDPNFVYRGSFNEVYPLLGLTGGVRYKLNEHLLTNVEIGWGPVSSLQFGLTFKL
jgi:hypothetical protein